MGDRRQRALTALATGVYRLRRDAGYVVGALVGAVEAHLLDLRAAVMTVAVLSVVSGLVVASRMQETVAVGPAEPGRRPTPGRDVPAACRSARLPGLDDAPTAGRGVGEQLVAPDPGDAPTVTMAPGGPLGSYSYAAVAVPA